MCSLTYIQHKYIIDTSFTDTNNLKNIKIRNLIAKTFCEDRLKDQACYTLIHIVIMINSLLEGA